MEILEQIFSIIFYKTDAPPPLFGALHIVSLILTAVFTFLICKYLMNASDKAIRRFCLTIWILLTVLELYKQVYYSFTINYGVITFYYQWYIFPFQLCATPLYTLPLIAFLPDGKVRDAIISFVASYALFGGLVVMIYPGDVFIRVLGISIQTMIHHGIQCGIGIFFALKIIKEGKKTKKRFFIESGLVFAAFLAIAIVLNIIVYNLLEASGSSEVFNMFYISPYYDTTLPVLSLLNSAPYPVLLIAYILGFTAAAAIVFMIQLGIYKLVLRIKESKNQPA